MANKVEGRGTVDVVIPVYRPGREFEKVLSGLFSQTLKPSHVILMVTADADGNSTLPAEYLRESVETYLVRPEDFDHGGTRNAGVEKSQADYVLLMTQDAVPADDQLIEKLRASFDLHEDCAAAYARQLPKEDAGVIERFTRGYNYPETAAYKTAADREALGIRSLYLSDVTAMYLRERFLTLGGFIDRTIFNEDMIFASKAMDGGYGIYYQPEARVWHSHSYTGREQFRRNFDLAVSQADHPEVFGRFRSEGEGIRMVKKTAAYLVKNGAFFKVFSLVYQSGMKYLGYYFGKRYQKLSARTVQRFTMNRNYWRGTKWDRSK